jgi:hypothetical protein
LKPTKQMLGTRHHEYLQRSAFSHTLPTKPVATILETIATGNWYKRSATWYDSTISSVSDSCFELYRRGVSFPVAQALARKIISASMRVYDRKNDSWIRLEWWSYRNPTGTHPLWPDSGKTSPCPMVLKKPAPSYSAPTLATDAYITHTFDILRHLPPEKLGVLKKEMLTESYGSIHTSWRMDINAESALEKWPRRNTHSQICEAPTCWNVCDRPEVFLTFMACRTAQHAPNSERDAIARLGLEPLVVRLLGGLPSAWRLADPKKLARYQEPTPPTELPWRLQAIDSALLSWMTASSNVPDKLIDYYR